MRILIDDDFVEAFQACLRGYLKGCYYVIIGQRFFGAEVLLQIIIIDLSMVGEWRLIQLLQNWIENLIDLDLGLFVEIFDSVDKKFAADVAGILQIHVLLGARSHDDLDENPADILHKQGIQTQHAVIKRQQQFLLGLVLVAEGFIEIVVVAVFVYLLQGCNILLAVFAMVQVVNWMGPILIVLRWFCGIIEDSLRRFEQLFD